MNLPKRLEPDLKTTSLRNGLVFFLAALAEMTRSRSAAMRCGY
jgi:hypothetical protein